jgi:broad specificity phosphatase PhoE
VRHGKTALNNPSNPIVRGWKDEQLSPAGQVGIQATASKLKPYKPQYIISSDFMRDTQSAHILAGRLGISGVETDFNARTWDVGEYSGKPESEVNAAIQGFYRRSWDVPPGSSESFDDFSRRWLDFVDRRLSFADIEGMRPLVIVTHGRNIALCDSYFNHKMPQDGMMPLPAGCGILAVNPDTSLNFTISDESEPVAADV